MFYKMNQWFEPWKLCCFYGSHWNVFFKPFIHGSIRILIVNIRMKEITHKIYHLSVIYNLNWTFDHIVFSRDSCACCLHFGMWQTIESLYFSFLWMSFSLHCRASSHYSYFLRLKQWIWLLQSFLSRSIRRPVNKLYEIFHPRLHAVNL